MSNTALQAWNLNVVTEKVSVEVAYATPKKQVLIALDVSPGTTIEEAIDQCGIKAEFPGMDIDPARVGIFGNKARLEDELRAGDRVEIYRPLIADPKEARRKRAALAKQNLKAGTAPAKT